MEIGYVAIICDTFEDAKESFAMFHDYIMDRDPWDVVFIFAYGLCIQLNDDLRYIFITKGYEDHIWHLQPDYISVEEFFDDVYVYDEFYYGES